MSDEETVLTTRRALLRTDAGWVRGRLRVTDRRVRFTALDGALEVEVPLVALSEVRVSRGVRRALVLSTPDGVLRLRCFAVPAVAGLLA